VHIPTIFALASGRPPAAIAIIRISGAQAHEAGRRIAHELPEPREVGLRELKHPRTGLLLDRALALRFDAPASSTGEDVVEFHIHGGRAVADATLDLFATFPLNRFLPAPVVRRVSWAVMDEPLLDAFGYPHPHPVVRALVRAGLRARGRVLRFLPPRRRPFFFRQLPQVRSYPDGYEIERLGTFPDRARAGGPG